MLGRRLRLLASYLRRDLVVPVLPSVVAIEVTNRCRLRCTMCPRAAMTRPIGDIRPTLFDRILDDIAEGVEFLWLQDCGEPLLHPDLPALIGRARKRGLRTGVSTSGMDLGRRETDEILDSGLDQILFSIDGATAVTYEGIRRGGDHRAVLANVGHFLERKRARGAKVFTVVQCIRMEQTLREIDAFRRQWSLEGVDAVRIRQLSYGAPAQRRREQRKQPPCFYLWSYPIIKHDGSLVACCQDFDATLTLGNLADVSFGEAWNGPAMGELRRLHIEGRRKEIPLCSTCAMYQPNLPMVVGGSILPYPVVTRWIPRIETWISSRSPG